MLTWLEQRTGFVSMTKGFLTEDIPGGASYWYVFGSATLFAMIVQIATGIFLTFFYAPSADTAWESTKAMTDNGIQHFVLSVHYWGASAMIALVAMHLLQALIWGAYKAPRELQWIVGVSLLLITLVLGLTGYLLPWDMNAYFASQVSINIAGTVPLIGPFVQKFLQGGAIMGTATLNRFFGVHVWLMPAALVLLVGAHLAIFRHNGPAGPAVDNPRPLRPGRFWPNQMFMDTVASFIVFVGIIGLAALSPAPLDAKADPSVLFNPYPAWYFLSLFGILNLMPPWAEVIGTIVLPGIAVLILLLVPWLDRSTVRTYSSRRMVLGAAGLGVLSVIILSVYGQMAILKKAGEFGPAASASQVSGAATHNAPASNNANGAKIYSANCSSCHGATGGGLPGSIPPLASNSYVTGDAKTLIHTVLFGLHGTLKVNGQTYNGTMPPWRGTLSNAEVASVLSYVRSSWGNSGGPITEKQVAGVKK